MVPYGRCAAVGLVIVMCTSAWAQQEDLLAKYGTRSLPAALHIDAAIKLSKAKKHEDALKAIDEAVRADPKAQMAHYWRGNILADLGNPEEAEKAFEKAVALARPVLSDVTVSSLFNLGMVLGRLGRLDESAEWFSRAILADPANRMGQRGVAYRNLAITFFGQKKPLAATIAAAQAYRDDPRNTPSQMVTDFAAQVVKSETARVLLLKEGPASPAKRAPGLALSPVDVPGDPLPDRIYQLLPDRQGRFIIAMRSNSPCYYLIDTEQTVAVRKLPVPGEATAGCLAGDRLYIATRNPSKLYEMEPMTGKVLRSFDLAVDLVRSIAAFPAIDMVYFPVRSCAWGLNLRTRQIVKTEVPAQHVVAHPSQSLLFSYYMDNFDYPGAARLIVDGRRIMLSFSGEAYAQTTVFQSLVMTDGLLVAGVRLNAACDALDVAVSPEGNWIAVPGKGGWYPNDASQGKGCVVPVFDALNIERLVGVFNSDVHLWGAAFNPVTHQFAVVNAKKVYVYHLGDPKDAKPQVVEGNFMCGVAWSGRGDYLVVADRDKGLRVFANPLTEPEKKLAATWWRPLVKAPARTEVVPLPTPVAPSDPTATAVVAGFVVTDGYDHVKAALDRAIRSGRTTKLPSWQQHAAYGGPQEIHDTIEKAQTELLSEETAGFASYRLKKLLEKHPNALPARHFMAAALSVIGRRPAARQMWEQCIRQDAGRTDLACLSLNSLASYYLEDKAEMSAIYCLATSLWLDRCNPDTLDLLTPLLHRNRLPEYVPRLAQIRDNLPETFTRLPALALPDETSPMLPPDKIYEKGVASVVLVSVVEGGGSGFCVGPGGLILTNNHVLGKQNAARVYTFEYKDGKLTRSTPIPARVVYRSDPEDTAILRLIRTPDSLKVLTLAPGDPRPGTRIYAIGNPGLGDDVLEQTITEGIVSSINRRLEGQILLQHTAAVNPGNSGGPLLNEKCEVVGMITLKASLRNVSFAIPARVIRRRWEKLRTADLVK